MKLHLHTAFLTNIVARDTGAARAAFGNDVATRSNVVNLAAGGTDAAAAASGGSIGECPGTEVSKRASTAAKLNNPLGVGKAQRLAHVVERSVHRLAGGQVLETGSARVGRSGVHSHAQLVAALHRELVAVVHWRLGVPLVPGGDGAITESLNTSLEDGAVAVGTCIDFFVSTMVTE